MKRTMSMIMIVLATLAASCSGEDAPFELTSGDPPGSESTDIGDDGNNGGGTSNKPTPPVLSSQLTGSYPSYTIKLAWSGAKDQDGTISKYRIFGDNVQTPYFVFITETTTTSWNDYPPPGVGHVYYYVTAVDDDGLESDKSNTVDVNVP